MSLMKVLKLVGAQLLISRLRLSGGNVNFISNAKTPLMIKNFGKKRQSLCKAWSLTAKNLMRSLTT
ncbi:MAG: hypothetical protein IJK81_04250 [Selenomonadaceae bacterium]|nr:hypothetical protein [Selenomonadaceae bacterium]